MRGLLAAAVWMAAVGASASGQGGGAPLTRSLMFDTCCVRETQDQAWRIRIVGVLPRGPGLFAMVFDQEGRRVLAAEIPFGTHTEAKPFTLTVPADGAAQEYVIKLVGQQDNFTGIRLPITDLPFEVYRGRYFAIGYPTAPGQLRRVAFKLAPGMKFAAQGHGGGFRILDDRGEVVADSVKDGPKERGALFEPALQPGVTYWIDPPAIFYLGTRDPLCLTFDPDRWFAPSGKLDIDKLRWWKGLGQ